MKARSPKLAQYLEETGAINGSPEDIARAKIEYRKAYKAEHKKKSASKHNELRPQFTPPEYEAVKEKADALGITPTAYVKAVSLNYDTGILPHKDVLLNVLQILSMTTIVLERERHPAAASLYDAEKMLTEYLRNH